MRKHGKRVVGVCIAMVCLLLVYALWGSAWPRRWFISYDFYYQATSGVVGRYPEKLPSSAENVSYYYYKGMFDTKTAVSFILDEEEYQEQKERYLLLYTVDEEEHQRNRQEYLEKRKSEYGKIPDWVTEDNVRFVFGDNVTSDFLEEQGLEYLRKVFHDSEDHYTILTYKGIGDMEGGKLCNLEGVLCNDETNELVIFDFRDVFRKSRQ